MRLPDDFFKYYRFFVFVVDFVFNYQLAFGVTVFYLVCDSDLYVIAWFASLSRSSEMRCRISIEASFVLSLVAMDLAAFLARLKTASAEIKTIATIVRTAMISTREKPLAGRFSLLHEHIVLLQLFMLLSIIIGSLCTG